MFLTWHYSANFQLALRDPRWSCLHAASPNQAHTHLAPFRGTVHCVHIALACRIHYKLAVTFPVVTCAKTGILFSTCIRKCNWLKKVQIGVQIEAATPFPHRSSPVQAAHPSILHLQIILNSSPSQDKKIVFLEHAYDKYSLTYCWFYVNKSESEEKLLFPSPPHKYALHARVECKLSIHSTI